MLAGRAESGAIGASGACGGVLLLAERGGDQGIWDILAVKGRPSFRVTPGLMQPPGHFVERAALLLLEASPSPSARGGAEALSAAGVGHAAGNAAAAAACGTLGSSIEPCSVDAGVDGAAGVEEKGGCVEAEAPEVGRWRQGWGLRGSGLSPWHRHGACLSEGPRCSTFGELSGSRLAGSWAVTSAGCS